MKGMYNAADNKLSINGINLIHVYKYDPEKTIENEFIEVSNIFPLKTGQTLKTGTDGAYTVRMYKMT